MNDRGMRFQCFSRAAPCAAALLLLAAASACAPNSVSEPAASAASSARAGNVIDSEGYGPVAIGMSIAEANAALGATLAAEEALDDPDLCQIWHLGPAGESAVYYMAQQGRISRVSVGEGGEAIRTPEGVGVGSTDADVRGAYPAAQSQPAPYDEPPAHELIVWTELEKSGLRFELNQAGRVVALHAGDDSILYIEGCA